METTTTTEPVFSPRPVGLWKYDDLSPMPLSEWLGNNPLTIEEYHRCVDNGVLTWEEYKGLSRIDSSTRMTRRDRYDVWGQISAFVEVTLTGTNKSVIQIH